MTIRMEMMLRFMAGWFLFVSSKLTQNTRLFKPYVTFPYVVYDKKTSEIWIVLQKLDINETVFVLSDAQVAVLDANVDDFSVIIPEDDGRFLG